MTAPIITSTEEATQRLTEWRVNDGGVPTDEGSERVLATDTGWAFFNADGYLGSVTFDGEVIIEDEYVEEE